MSNYIDHANRELKSIGYKLGDTEEGPNKWIVENIHQLLNVFAEQGHSGSSAPHVVKLFAKIALFEPVGPLRGTDDEWMEVGPDLFQNVRCGHVFKDKGRVYDSEGKVFREPSGACYLNSDSRVDITFPYTPTRVYVDRPESV